MKELSEDIRGETQSELQGLFEQYLGSFTATPVIAAPVGPTQDCDKGMLGSSPTRFPLRDAPLLSPDVNMKNVIQGGQWDESVRSHRQGGLHGLTSEAYAQGLRERFGSTFFQDLMAELVSLKQQRWIDHFHDVFYQSYSKPLFKLMMASNQNGVNLSQLAVGSNFSRQQLWSLEH
ncbi:hypothetical protein PVK06_024742 [Gossypium arboreum]|uniref:Uncharacterized protein n=1 Tax=Gossypium arboreum TaxID=29729 RepID=A0ABR0PF57_GOSAR|nr:hypothetical protein PVK06_024742 [Gossypium arboreum]